MLKNANTYKKKKVIFKCKRIHWRSFFVLL